MVTFNYRLAHFGFTSTGKMTAIGNAGFKDQVLVLKWVNDHIHNFGGDNKLITLMGDSAGALSISLHLVSPMSQNLFHRAFMMSGSIQPQSEIRTEQNFLVNKLGQYLKCNESTDTFECVKKAETHSITKSLRAMFDFGFDNPIYRWLPVIESEFHEEEQFLIQNPIELLQTGNFSRVPILMSATKDEISMSAMYLFENPDLLKNFVENFTQIGPICFSYEPNETISNALKEWYIQDNLDDQKHYIKLYHQIAEVIAF